MSDLNPEIDPDWDSELAISLSPTMIIDTIFYTADSVHTGAESCVDPEFVLVDIYANDERSDNYCRFAEQRYTEEEDSDVTWQDWTVELRLQGTYITAHWRIRLPGSPADWDWSARESERAFRTASVLVGRRVRKAIAVEEPAYAPMPSHTRH